MRGGIWGARIAGIFVIGATLYVVDVWAFKTSTHRALNLRAAEISILVKDDYLRQQLGLSNGLAERFSTLQDPVSKQNISEWIQRGGVAEDEFMGSEGLVGPLNRSR